MIIRDIDRQMETLYSTYENREGLFIATGITFEGDPVNFQFLQEDDKYSCLATNRNFFEWMVWCTGDLKKASPQIEKIAAIYGVGWDADAGRLYIRFRRNEMTIAQAILRLQQTVSVVGAMGSV